MNSVLILSPNNMDKNFISSKYIPYGKDEYYLRNRQTISPQSGWRHLTSTEIERLEKNNNSANSWENILVTDFFRPEQIKDSRFFGLVRIGCIRNIVLQQEDLRVPSGITNSLIISCDIGNDVAIHNVHYLAHYIIGDNNILLNIGEMSVSDHAKFGNGIIKEGETESERTWMELMNESGCRKVLPFDGMLTADAYLWAKYIDDLDLQKNLKEITQNSMDYHRGYYGTTGNNCVIKDSLIIKDVKIDSHCLIEGASKLQNLTIHSSEVESTKIGEGSKLVNGIVGFGCRIDYGSIAVCFVIGNNSNLKYGARLLNTFLGDNSTISCCEVLNNLIFPAHEQHHNNSFLIASLVMGQSNLAAGATIGSNHNSRSNDHEIQAGRGFWPGLCASVKHSCRFASFMLLSKADYPFELDIQLPFSLLSNNTSKDQLEVMPAYWWMYNMYALARNSRKYKDRDKRINKTQHIEFEPLAPDTVEEIANARQLLEIWTAKAYLRANGKSTDNIEDKDLIKSGRDLLSGDAKIVESLDVYGENMENSKRKVVILKTYNAWHAYEEMITYYAIKNLLVYMESNQQTTFSSMCKDLKGKREKEWVNLGGQIMQKKDLDKIRSDTGSGKLTSWKDIHDLYDKLWDQYPLDKQKHAFAVLCGQYKTETLTEAQWLSALNRFIYIQQFVCDQVYISRNKDYKSPFVKSTFRNPVEMTTAIGTIDENSFIISMQQETETIKKLVENVKKRI
jgi:hypothetical protein